MSKEDDGDCGDEFDTVGLPGTCAKRVRKERTTIRSQQNGKKEP